VTGPGQREAYNNGLCAHCKTQTHSAGRPLCETCHHQQLETYEPEADRNNYPCRTTGCGAPTRPGNVICYPCLQQRKTGAKK